MIEKIKVTKQEIRTYESDGRIMSYTYSKNFLDAILAPEGKYEISDKNANVTWYKKASVKDAEVVETIEAVKPNSDVDEAKKTVVDILQKDGFELTDSAIVAINSNDYDIELLKQYAKNNKITGHTIKKVESHEA